MEMLLDILPLKVHVALYLSFHNDSSPLQRVTFCCWIAQTNKYLFINDDHNSRHYGFNNTLPVSSLWSVSCQLSPRGSMSPCMSTTPAAGVAKPVLPPKIEPIPDRNFRSLYRTISSQLNAASIFDTYNRCID